MFEVWWSVSFVVLLFVTGLMGYQLKRKWSGILIDSRGRYSLTHFQVVLWTIVIISAVLGKLISNGFNTAGLVWYPELLGLMGISAGSAIFASGVKGVKDFANPDNIARAGNFDPGRTGQNIRIIVPKFSQIWLEEEGHNADKVINITKYQNFIFTIVVLIIFVVLAVKEDWLPKLPQNVIWLVGISHAGYVGAKVSDKK